jgi:uncharacterized membrane protein
MICRLVPQGVGGSSAWSVPFQMTGETEEERMSAQQHHRGGVTALDYDSQMCRGPGEVRTMPGRGRHRSAGFDLFGENWSPWTRLLIGATGGALLTLGARQRAPTACFLGTVGLGMLARSMTNVSLRRLLGIGAGARAVDIHKSFTIAAPVERVFGFWADYSNFPRFLRHLREVRDLGNGRSHWVASGPGGMPVSWNAVLTRFVPNELIAWRSAPGSVIANAGAVRFTPLGNEATRVEVCMGYNPPAGVLGHFAARLFATDAGSEMDSDLVALRSHLEAGKSSTSPNPAIEPAPVGVGA